MNMKKEYLIPNVKIHVMNYHRPLLAGTDRHVAGGPEEEGGVPPSVQETDGEVDPYDGHGQGSGGGGNRSKGLNVWDF